MHVASAWALGNWYKRKEQKLPCSRCPWWWALPFPLLKCCYRWPDSKMLRNLVCGHILQNWELWQSWVTMYGEGREAKQVYSQQMIQQNGWATFTCVLARPIMALKRNETAAEIMVAVALLKCRINIWLKVIKGFFLQMFYPHVDSMNMFETKWTFSVFVAPCRIFHKFGFFLVSKLWFSPKWYSRNR